MDKFLLLFLLLGAFPLVFFQAQATVCMVCKSFKNGHCLIGKGNCTVDSGPGCRTRNFFSFTDTGKWSYYHTELDCSDTCISHTVYVETVKIATYCCKDQDFCNRYQGKLVNRNTQ
ncbi:secreted seminal-vesicle Ly-6 protein 1 [Fukomys damarensis]|uniref:Secreted seminal-vesicle Ly-6 protein 1 n=1 Tax=Fukomys damarensis TaxID=885580 RepID=A0A091DGW4_FUKDA|nr:secreted seminal-vesicle Ly-6 protein 1 [Fukomys damarensis]KFO31379.1 hypothetical protein H920_07214 [Fukomys damarensis]